MDNTIIVALITGGFGFAGIIVANLLSGSKNTKKIIDDVKSGVNEKINEVKLEFASYKASTNEQIKELTREVRKHNNFAERVPKLEEKIDSTNEKIDYLHR